MAEQQGGIYDPASGRVLTIAEAQAAMRGGSLGLTNPVSGETQGINLPPVPGDDATAMLKSIPQIAGLLASFHPATRSSWGAAAGIPGVIDMIMQAAEKGIGNVDPMQSIVQGGMGMAGKAAGGWAEGAGRNIASQGGQKIIKSLRLPSDTSDQSIDMLRNLAVKEGAQLTKGSEAAIRTGATQTLPNGVRVTSKPHIALADAMGSARRADALAPPRMTLWPQEAIANWSRRAPRQMRAGQAMVRGGRNLEGNAKGLEAMVRSIMAYLAGQDSGADSEATGPRRRGQ